jgi:hypothetical protein
MRRKTWAKALGLAERSEKEEGRRNSAGQRFDGGLFGQSFADRVFHLMELADGQAAADLGFLAGGIGIFLAGPN